MKNVARSSSFVERIETSLRKGEATVYLKDGNIYQYSNVSRRAIINLSVNQNLSLGFWFNENCAQSDRVVLVNKSWETPWLTKQELDEDYSSIIDEDLQDLVNEYNEEYAQVNAY